MSTQIAVRLPDELVEFVDELVGSGSERSRAAVVARALERERRVTIPTAALGARIGVLLDRQEQALGEAVRAAFDLD